MTHQCNRSLIRSKETKKTNILIAQSSRCKDANFREETSEKKFKLKQSNIRNGMDSKFRLKTTKCKSWLIQN
ncbi:putative inactive polypeptide N-acetylgalactosaminyltransferase [Dirofilaria immitis]